MSGCDACAQPGQRQIVESDAVATGIGMCRTGKALSSRCWR